VMPMSEPSPPSFGEFPIPLSAKPPRQDAEGKDRQRSLWGLAAARSQERATANSRPPPISYLAFALAAAAAVAEGSAKAITASPSSKLVPGLPPKP
jgi:hypothetical protein